MLPDLFTWQEILFISSIVGESQTSFLIDYYLPCSKSPISSTRYMSLDGCSYSFIKKNTPLIWKVITLFSAMDLLLSRSGMTASSGKNFEERFNLLEEKNDSEKIFKICYGLLRLVRNSYTHKVINTNNKNSIDIDEFSLNGTGQTYFFDLVFKIIELFDGYSLNQYDLEFLKIYLKMVFNNISFKNNKCEKIKIIYNSISINNSDLDYFSSSKRGRRIIFYKNIKEYKSSFYKLEIDKNSNISIKDIKNNSMNIPLCKTVDYLILIPSEEDKNKKNKYLIFADKLESDISKWIIKDNYRYIGFNQSEECKMIEEAEHRMKNE